MRKLFLALFVLGAAALVWHATGPKAKAIEADIDRRTEAAVAPLATHPVEVATDGRDVTLTGLADSTEERSALIAAATAVRGNRVLLARIEVLPLAQPYEFTAEKAANGSLTLAGFMPNEALRAALVARAAALAGAAGVTDNIQLATGAPGGGWGAMAEAALSGLGPLDNGSAWLSDRLGGLSGSAPDTGALADAAAAVGAATDVTWETDLRLTLDDATPFSLDAAKPAEGPVTLSGHAPGPEARDRLVAEAARIGGTPEGTLQVAEPAPPEGWTDTAADAIRTLGGLLSGKLAIRGDAVVLTGEIGTDPEADALRASAAPGWQVELTVLKPDPPATLRIVLPREGKMTATGILPRGIARSNLATALPDADLSGITGDGRGGRTDWNNVITGLAAIMPRFRDAAITIEGTAISVSGRLRPGFNAEEARSALRTAAGPAWTVTFDVREAPPDAVLAVVLSDDGLDIAGILPEGMTADSVTGALGGTAESLGTGGDGDLSLWEDAIAMLGKLLPLSSALEARFKGDTLTVNATLRPGYSAGEAAAYAATSSGLDAALELAETEPGPGDTRANLATGETEAWQSGYWLPEMSFEPEAETCTTEAARLFEQGQITFVTGSAEIDAEAEALLNRLAAVAIRCLNGRDGRLIVGGHTDDVGDARANTILSRERAGAVVAALRDRGVAPGAMLAVGYGTLEPVAGNDTEAGRAQNRRISFAFTD